MTPVAISLLSDLLAEIFASQPIDSLIYDKAHKFWSEVESAKFTDRDFIRAALPVALGAEPEGAAADDECSFSEAEIARIQGWYEVS